VSVPRALASVGEAIGGARGGALSRAAGQLAVGTSWSEIWWGAPPELTPVREVLDASWERGVAPAGPLATAAAELRTARHARAMHEANRLGVRLVLPLGLCYLPAFVLVGIVPVLMSMAAGVLRG
jgi:hypothetical protein